MKAIDFHIHTLAEKGKDQPFSFSQEWLNSYIIRAELDAIAISNHNFFDSNQFHSISEATSIPVFPGMELSLMAGHVLVVYDPSPQFTPATATLTATIALALSPSQPHKKWPVTENSPLRAKLFSSYSRESGHDPASRVAWPAVHAATGGTRLADVSAFPVWRASCKKAGQRN